MIKLPHAQKKDQRESKSLALVYLARGIDGGLRSAKEFFEAYRAFPAGCPHELIVIAKGWAGIDGQAELLQLIHSHSARLVDLPDDGFDWGGYMRLAPQLSHDWLCFLNTHSRPRVTGWLNLLKAAADAPSMNIGAVSASASWQSLDIPILPPPSLRKGYNTILIYPLRLFRNMLRLAINIRQIGDFAPFPNPHLRSNAFIIRRELFVDFAATQRIPRCKRDAALLESGRLGFSVYLANRGLKALVTGADGKVYGPEQWINSGTFRAPGQPNLLVADNQTTAYDMADQHLKRVLERLAWGQAFS